MSKNRNLISAKTTRNDNYYTRLEDVERELSHYPGAFYEKTILLPCDSADQSAFWKYFEEHFSEFGLKRLVATRWDPDSHGIRSDLFINECGFLTRVDSELDGDGNMFSEEVQQMFHSADLIITNLPFSRFRECIKIMMNNGNNFIVIGGKNGGKYQDTIGYVMNGRMRLGANEGHGSMRFETPSGNDASVASYWFTTLVPDCPPRQLKLSCSYEGNEKSYPRYANYDAIEVPKVSLIPDDYNGKMGVPITFLEYFDPNEWELLGTNATVLEDAPQDPYIKANSHLYRRHNLYIEQEDGDYHYKRIYDRLIVQRRSS